ncbi:MAG: thiamine diphosphokinase [Oscillospiraceae bacterium]|nr:thiamine diphosphokinase [Oscillospiraceae bacterium]
MNKCIIIGAGEFDGFRDEYTADYVIAADGGIDNLQCKADLLIGDFDSAKALPADVEQIRFPKEKDQSDLELAVAEAIKRGFNCFYIYGALGKRLDHSLASIAVLTALSQRGCTGYLLGTNEIITAVTNSSVTLKPQFNSLVSVFPAGNNASGVSLKGVKYPLENAVLTNGSTLGLSNEIVGDAAFIEVQNGTLIIVNQA